MKKLKYFTIFTMIFGAMAFACSDDSISPLGTHNGGDSHEDDPIIIDPPSDSTRSSVAGSHTYEI